MSAKSSSTLQEVPGVTNAVEHLQELALRMTGDDFFNENDVGTIDRIVSAIHELESECGKLHEKLETETIKASVLRHTLQFLPGQIKEEIHNAVSAARQSNADELNSLQTQLKDINDNTERLNQRHADLEHENSILHPERDTIRQKHEEIISMLNQKMAEKASKQIVLNETRDQLRETNQNIIDLEEGILQLKEDLIQERADARMEKKHLKKCVYDTTLTTREQDEENTIKKKEVDKLHEELMVTEGRMTEVKGSVHQHERMCSSLEGQEKALSEQLRQEIKQNQELQQRALSLTNRIAEQEKNFEEKQTELQKQFRKLDSELKADKKSNEDLNNKKEKFEQSLMEKTFDRQRDEKRVKRANSALQKAKGDLAMTIEESARLTQENIDMEERIVSLGETHQAIVSTFQKQIDDMRETLSKERYDRMELQSQRDDVHKEVDDFKTSTQKKINLMNKLINEGKKKHDELTKEGTMLQKSLREDDDKSKRLKEQSDLSRKDLNAFQAEKEAEIAELEREITNMKKKLQETSEEITERTPSCNETETHHDDQMEKYDQIKKDIVALKNKKIGLEDAVKRAQREVDKMVAPTNQLRSDIQTKRAESLETMKSQATEVTEIEKKIYATGCKLKTALEENDRFFEANSKSEEEIRTINSQTSDSENLVEVLHAELAKLKDMLAKEWEKDHEMEEAFAARDQALVDELGLLLNKTEQRENVIAGVTHKLQDELVVLARFLDNVARRRPKDTRESKRPAHAAKEAKGQKASAQTRKAIETVAKANMEAGDIL